MKMKTAAKMKCLRVYSTADGESHFDEVEIPTTSRQVHPNAAAFEVSAKYAASGIRFTHIPAGARQVDWHTVPERVLTVRLDGSAEYQTSDGDERHHEDQHRGNGDAGLQHRLRVTDQIRSCGRRLSRERMSAHPRTESS